MENKTFSTADRSGTPGTPAHGAEQTDRVCECVHPDWHSCRGCEHSFNPDRFDGGCRLYYDESYREAYLKGGAD